MMPTSAAHIAVVMNSAILTRATGTPTLRAAFASPPTAKIQLPTRVRESTQVATAAIDDPPDHAEAEVVRRPERVAEHLGRALVARHVGQAGRPGPSR